MKNKRSLMIFIVIMLLICIPIIAFASKKAIENLKVDDMILEEANKAKEKSQKVNSIINKYYSEEYNKLIQNRKNETKDEGIVDIKNSKLSQNQIDLYDLVLKILENENLSDEDSELLKDYIDSNMYEIKKDTSLTSRAEKILSE